MQFSYDSGAFRVLNCRLGVRNVTADCAAAAYSSTLWAWALPSCVFGGLVLLLGIAYFSMRGLNNLHSGASPQLDAEAGAADLSSAMPRKVTLRHDRVYSECDLLRPKVLVAFCFVLSVAGCAWGCHGTTALLGALKSLNDSAGGVCAAFEAVNDEVLAELAKGILAHRNFAQVQATEQPSHLDALTLSVKASNAKLNRMVSLTTVKLSHGVVRYAWVTYLFLPAAAVISCVLALMSCCHCHGPALTGLLATFFVLCALLFAVHGVSLRTKHLVHDSCVEVSDYTERRANNVLALTECSSWTGTGFVDRNRNPDEIAAAFTAIQRSVLALGTRMCEQDHAASSKKGALLGKTQADACENKSVQELLVSLPSPAHRNLSSRADNDGDALLLLWRALTDGQLPQSCMHVAEKMMLPLGHDCTVAAKASESAANGSGLCAFASVLGVLCLLTARKRFLPLSQAFVPQRPS